jgi:hypothetical protein
LSAKNIILLFIVQRKNANLFWSIDRNTCTVEKSADGSAGRLWNLYN